MNNGLCNRANGGEVGIRIRVLRQYNTLQLCGWLVSSDKLPIVLDTYLKFVYGQLPSQNVASDVSVV